MILQYLGGCLSYCAAVAVSYTPALKNSRYYTPIGLAVGMLANLFWLSIARSTNDSNQILLLGFYWDAMLTLTYLLVPIMFYDARLTLTSGAGIALMVAGFILTKF